MELSIFLAKAWGLYLILITLALLINKNNIRSLLGVLDNDGGVMMSGAVSLVVGVLSVIGHNIWVGPIWVLLVTIFGWAALLKGIMRLAWPKHIRKFIDDIDRSGAFPVLLIISFLVGAYLFYSGYLG